MGVSMGLSKRKEEKGKNFLVLKNTFNSEIQI